MTVPFSTTLRALEAERLGPGRWISALLVLLGVGGVLFFTLARVPIFVRVPGARVEVEGRAYPVQVPGHAGSVAWAGLRLGEPVQAGQLLVQLEPHLELHQLEAEQARLRALELEIASTELQRQHQVAALAHDGEVESLGLDEAQALLEEASATARASSLAHERAASLHTNGLVSAAELETARARAEADSAIVVSRGLAREREQREAARLRTEREAEVRRLEGKIAHLRGEAEVSQTAIESFQHELAHFQIVSPITGRLAWIADVKAGSYLAAGSQIAVVVPDAPLHVRARFDASASGRVQVGQPGALRLDAFPWTEYGVVRAEVQRVGRESLDGSLVVDLAIPPESQHRALLEHGMTGTLEIEVERRSPLLLALRTFGRLRTGPSGPARPESPVPGAPASPATIPAGDAMSGFDAFRQSDGAVRAEEGEEAGEENR